MNIRLKIFIPQFVFVLFLCRPARSRCQPTCWIYTQFSVNLPLIDGLGAPARRFFGPFKRPAYPHRAVAHSGTRLTPAAVPEPSAAVAAVLQRRKSTGKMIENAFIRLRSAVDEAL
ncbi:MAG TPA: hypothetical protein VMK31_05470 [Sphingomicrobium sp.]|nr:hypothetical protein [Sphingomicrobium sp.]